MTALGEWVDYDDLTERQQMEAHLARPRWLREDFHHFAFLVSSDGHVRRKDPHRVTNEARKTQLKILEIALPQDDPDKGGMRHFSVGSFGLNKEPV